MHGRLFAKPVTENTGKAICMLTDILISMHNKGSAQESIKRITDMNQPELLPAIRLLLIIERDKSQELATSLKQSILLQLRNDKTMRANSSFDEMFTGNTLTDAFVQYGNTVGLGFSQQWQNLGNTYLNTLAVIKRNSEIIRLLDNELNRQEAEAFKHSIHRN